MFWCSAKENTITEHEITPTAEPKQHMVYSIMSPCSEMFQMIGYLLSI